MEPTSRWRAVRTADGSFTLASPEHGEACHSLAGAWTQALERYARPCRLRERALAGEGPLRLLDVGTGLGLNLTAALHELADTCAALDVLSLELEPDVVRAALELDESGPLLGPEIASTRAAVRQLLRGALDRGGGSFVLGAHRVRVVFGDARRTLADELEPATFDAVCFDPFSPKVAPECWTSEFLALVAARMGPRSILSTYSSAVRVRTTLMELGLCVGVGPRVGTKASGTLASKGLEVPAFDARTARKLRQRLARKAFPGPNPSAGAESGGPFP
ncbi:MAG: hypothetical protein L6Q99_11345 [Planctomycetes bacterium]|nr:hypothetical protein [Planctomycetota bacterium]